MEQSTKKIFHYNQLHGQIKTTKYQKYFDIFQISKIIFTSFDL